MKQMQGARIHITGVIQGVGFRPFVYGLATRLALTGWVRNTSAGVDIEVDGTSDSLQSFVKGLRQEAPPLARIEEIEVQERPVDGYTTFEIEHSQSIDAAFQPISPDVSICPDCLRELFDPPDRRFRYPFINCTNCGPRFTIIEDIPYDRPKTTMAGFPLCPACAAEYANPLDRRFHAQPVACPVCGPEVWLEPSHTNPATKKELPSGETAIQQAQHLLLNGRIVAVKGLGGFHLACDATNPVAVAELRQRKLRVDKPFALMMLNLDMVEAHCYLSAAERELLTSHERPVVLLRRKPEATIAREIAPQQDYLGVMLPYTPLHYLLFTSSEAPSIENPVLPPLVMTSGNLSEEPIATGNDEARQRLASLADAFLMHNRPIHTRCDDSVVRATSAEIDHHTPPSLTPSRGEVFPIRRSRGYAPFPVRLPWESPPVLAVGAELKNTFCITRERYAFLSHHIGDLENYETLRSFEEGVAHFESLFRIDPQVLAYDLHPNYLATRYALERAGREGIPAIGIQHHHAHIAACMADHGRSNAQPVIGVAFDGTGYGEDGAIWGGEFLIAHYDRYQRAAQLKYYPLPGGDAAIRKPGRIAMSYLWQSGLDWDPVLPSVGEFCVEERAALRSMLEHQLNTPLTSSMGRLFDAIAALCGVRQKVNYEAQAAIELEALVDPMETGAFSFDLEVPDSPRIEDTALIIDPTPAILEAVSAVRRNLPVPVIAARFHNGVARMVVQVCRILRDRTGIAEVALSGGVWQNMTLLNKTITGLAQDDFIVFIHRQVPANDGGLALGQAAIAAHRLPA